MASFSNLTGCSRGYGASSRRDGVCGICQEFIHPTQRNITHIACKNTFCSECLLTWAGTQIDSGSQAKCPYCKKEISKSEPRVGRTTHSAPFQRRNAIVESNYSEVWYDEMGVPMRHPLHHFSPTPHPPSQNNISNSYPRTSHDLSPGFQTTSTQTRRPSEPNTLPPSMTLRERLLYATQVSRNQNSNSYPRTSSNLRAESHPSSTQARHPSEPNFLPSNMSPREQMLYALPNSYDTSNPGVSHRLSRPFDPDSGYPHY